MSSLNARKAPSTSRAAAAVVINPCAERARWRTRQREVAGDLSVNEAGTEVRRLPTAIATRVGPIGPATYPRWFDPFDNYAPLWCFVAGGGRRGGDAMDIIFDIVSVRTFWRILLFVHFLLAVALLAAVTLQVVAVMIPVRQAAGNFVQRLQSGAGSVLRRRDRHPLCAHLPHGRVDLHQVPHLRQNSDGAIRPLVDCGVLRIQGACRDYGHGPPSGLLVFLAAASVRGTCQRAQVGDPFPGLHRLVRLFMGHAPTISEGSVHDTRLGCRRANLPSRPLPRDGRTDIGEIDDLDEGEQVRHLRDHVRHFIRDPVHGLRTAELAAFHLPSGGRQAGFLDAASPARGRPAHVLVWLGRTLLPRRVGVGWIATMFPVSGSTG